MTRRQRLERLWLLDLKPGHEPVELLPGKLSYLFMVPWPSEPAIDRKPLIQKDNAVFFIQDRLDPVMAPSAEEEQGIIVFAHMEFIFDNGTESVDLFAHIGTATYDIDRINLADIC